jgi:hypothetical protein
VRRVTYIDIAVVAGTGEDLIVELVQTRDLIVVDVFEEENRLLVTCVPHRNTAIQATGDEDIETVQSTQVANS